MAEEKKKCPAGIPAWMATFADMNTLLLTFFVLLVSTMTIDIKKFNLVLSAFKGAVGVLDNGRSINLTREELMNSGQTNARLGQQEDIIRPTQIVQQVLGWQEEATGKDVESEITERGFKILLTDKILFEAGSDRLTARGVQLLSQIAGTFLNAIVPNDDIRIEGYTDDMPSEGTDYSTNLELSSARAISVYRQLELDRVARRRMSIAAFGEQRPIERREGESVEDWRVRNRRVEIVVLWSEGEN